MEGAIFLTFVGLQPAFSFTLSFFGDENLLIYGSYFAYFALAYCSELLCVCFFLDIRTRVECRTVLFNLFVIVKPRCTFGFVTKPPPKIQKLRIACKKIKYLVTTLQKIIKYINK